MANMYIIVCPAIIILFGLAVDVENDQWFSQMYISFIAQESRDGTRYINLYNYSNHSYNSYNSLAQISVPTIFHCSHRY
jgi:hypothetical protein